MRKVAHAIAVLCLLLGALGSARAANTSFGPVCKGRAPVEPTCSATFVAEHPVVAFTINYSGFGVVRATMSAGQDAFLRTCATAQDAAQHCESSGPAHPIPAGSTVAVDVVAPGVGTYAIYVIYGD